MARAAGEFVLNCLSCELFPQRWCNIFFDWCEKCVQKRPYLLCYCVPVGDEKTKLENENTDNKDEEKGDENQQGEAENTNRVEEATGQQGGENKNSDTEVLVQHDGENKDEEVEVLPQPEKKKKKKKKAKDSKQHTWV